MKKYTMKAKFLLLFTIGFFICCAQTNLLYAQKVLDRGLAEVIMDGQSTQKNLILHRSIKVGTTVTIRNPANGRTTTAKVVSKLPSTGANEKLIAKISQSTYYDLKASGKRFALEIYPSYKTAATSNEVKHEVQSGETLYAISKKYNVSIEDLKKWNNLEGDVLNRGQQLKILKN